MKALGLGAALAGVVLSSATTGAEEFEEASLHFEQNATDGDAEVVLTIKGCDEGLEWLSVAAPDGRTVFEIACPEPAMLGLRSFRLESPEPPDHAAVQAAFPAGTYTFRGRMVTGCELESESDLNHTLPGIATFVYPTEEAEDVPVEDLRIRWRGPEGLDQYVVEIEHEESGTKLIVNLPGSVTSFATPADLVQPGLEYKVSIGTVTEEGNSSFVETTFTTAE